MQSSIDAESIEAFLKTSARRSSEAPRGERELTIPARDGYPLAATLFSEGAREAPLVVVSSATGVPRQFYKRFAKRLVARGFDVLTYDYRGIGGSRPRSLRRFRARMSDWGHEDFEGVLRYAKTRLGRETVRVVGHSVGGQLLGFAESNAMIERVACVASQLGDYRLWPRGEKLRMLATWYGVIPLANAVFGYVPGALGIGEDLPAGIAREWRDWCVTEGYFFGGGGESRRPGFARVHAPMLAVGVEADPFAPRAAVDAWVRAFPNARVTREHLEDRALGHFGFFRASSEARWDRIADFLA